MKRIVLVAALWLGLPAWAAGQVEIGVDAGLGIRSTEGADDASLSFEVPTGQLRLGLPVGERLMVEPVFYLLWASQGDESLTRVGVTPGVVLLFPSSEGRQFYVRGEAGLSWMRRVHDGDPDNKTQFGFGGAAGLRIPVEDHVLFRLEGGVERWLENEEDGYPASTAFRLLAGFSVTVGNG